MTREEAKLMAYSEDNSCKNKIKNPMMYTLHDLKQDKADIEAKISKLLLSFANEYEVDIQEIKLHQSKWQNLDSKKLTISLNVEVVVEI